MRNRMKHWLRRLVVAAACAGSFSPAFAQQKPAAPPPGYVSINVVGMVTVVPSLTTAMRNNLDAAENTSIRALAGEGQGSPALVHAALVSSANAFCAESQGQVPDCKDIPGTIAPFLAEADIVFNLVPKSQWDPTTFTATGLPVFAISYVKPPPPPVTAAPAKTFVGACIGIPGLGSICNPGVGVSAADVTNGQVVVQGGVAYTARISSGMMGLSLTFTPVGQ